MGRLRDYGSEPTMDIHGFPDCVAPEYLEAWSAYISTQTAQDLYNSSPQPQGMTRVVQGFLSSLSKQSTQFLVRAVPGVMSDSVKEARVTLKATQYDYKFWTDRIRLAELLRIADVKVVVNSTYNPIANCINASLEIYLVYVPKPVKGKIPKIGEVLHSKVPYWFSSKQPKALFKTDNLTKKLARSPIPVVPDTYPPVETAMAQPRLWHEWNEKLGISCIRCKGNSFVLHVSSPRMLCFLGSHRKQEMERKLISLARSIFI